jgi:hypothetical protein
MKIIRGSKNLLLKCHFWGEENFFKNGILGGAFYKNFEWEITYLKLKGRKKIWRAALWPCLLYKIAFPRKAYTIIFLSDFSVPEINASTYEGKSVILIGWGSKNPLGSVSNTLKKIDISVLPQRFDFFFL